MYKLNSPLRTKNGVFVFFLLIPPVLFLLKMIPILTIFIKEIVQAPYWWLKLSLAIIAIPSNSHAGSFNNQEYDRFCGWIYLTTLKNFFIIHSWTRCNNMIFSWILNSLSKEIAISVIYADFFMEMWSNIKEWLQWTSYFLAT